MYCVLRVLQIFLLVLISNLAFKSGGSINTLLRFLNCNQMVSQTRLLMPQSISNFSFQLTFVYKFQQSTKI